MNIHNICFNAEIRKTTFFMFKKGLCTCNIYFELCNMYYCIMLCCWDILLSSIFIFYNFYSFCKGQRMP